MTAIDLDEEREDRKGTGTVQQASAPTCIEKSSVQKELANPNHKLVRAAQSANPIAMAHTVKPSNSSQAENSGILKDLAQNITKGEIIPAIVLAVGIGERLKTENCGLFKRTYLRALQECKSTIADISLGIEEIKTYYFDIKDQITDKYLNFKKSVTDLLNSWAASAKNLYERCKCALHDGIKATARLLTTGKINIQPTIHTGLVLPILKESNAKTVTTHAGDDENSYSDTLKSSDGFKGFFKKIAEALEQLTEAFSHKKEEQKRKEAYELETKQKKLEEEACEALSEARFLRPDLADRLRKPQLAFLASSPFAHAPSAEDLISQAEDESKEQIH